MFCLISGSFHMLGESGLSRGNVFHGLRSLSKHLLSGIIDLLERTVSAVHKYDEFFNFH